MFVIKCYVSRGIKQEGKKQEAAGMHGSQVLFSLSEKTDRHAFKSFFLAIMPNITCDIACYFLSNETGRIKADKTSVGLS